MGKYKRLKKIMNEEFDHSHARINKLVLELAEVKRQAAKNLHPTTMTPEARNWCDVVDKEYQVAAYEAVARAKENESKRKRVVFRRVRADLFPTEFGVSRAQASELANLNVGYQIRTHYNRTPQIEFLLQFIPFTATDNVGDLTSKVNRILGDTGSVYAEVQLVK